MYRKLVLAVVAGMLAAPLVARAQHDDEFDSDWGWIDQGDQVEEYDFEQGQTVSLDTFQDGLSPYGQWVTVGAYGRVWHPAGVAVGWRPYYNGSWQWTDEGWLWVSSEPWGWATYHYGRWAFDGSYGWVWVPGYQWAPAWVSWRFGPEYIGWAPLGPGYSVYVTNYPVVYDHWCFVPSRRFVGVPVASVAYVGGSRVAPIYSRTQPAPPRATVHGAVAPAWGGPARPYVERQVGHAIAPVRVQAVASPKALGASPREGVVQVYRPEAARPSRGGAATRSGAVTAPGRAVGPSSPLPGGDRGRTGAGPGAGSPLPGGEHARPGTGGRVSPLPGGASRPSTPGGGAVSPLPGGAPVRRSPATSAPPHAAPGRPEAAPQRSQQQPVQSAPPPVARPRAQRYEDDGASRAAPARDYGGGGEAAPARSGGGWGGGNGGGHGGGNGGGGNGGGRGGGHAVPNRR